MRLLLWSWYDRWIVNVRVRHCWREMCETLRWKEVAA